MNPALLIALVKLAMQLPQFAADIRALVTHSGVDETEWERVAGILAQNPEHYFGPAAPPTPPPDGRPVVDDPNHIYFKGLPSVPSPLTLMHRGDRLWLSPDSRFYYINPWNSPYADMAVPAGYAYFGWYDGTRIVPASEDSNVGKRT